MDRLVSPRHPRPPRPCLTGSYPTPGRGREKGSAASLIPLTVPEVRRLLLTLTEPPDRVGFRLAWSVFRRRHQAVAQRGHAARHQPDPQGTLTVRVLGGPDLDLTDAGWALIAPLLPPQKPRTGRPAHDHRTILAGLLWVARTGAAWRDLPAHFGPWETVHSRYHRWRKAGLWQLFLEALSQDEVPDAPQLSL